MGVERQSSLSKSARRHFFLPPETQGDSRRAVNKRLSENFQMRIKRVKDRNGSRERMKERDFLGLFFEKSKLEPTSCGLERKRSPFGLCEDYAESCAPSEVFFGLEISFEIQEKGRTDSREAPNNGRPRKERGGALCSFHLLYDRFRSSDDLRLAKTER